jgi:hypothetical protein
MNAPAEAQTAATTAPVSFSAVPGAIGAEDVPVAGRAVPWCGVVKTA